MSVQSDTSKISYAGNNSTVTPYPVPFKFANNSDLVAVVTDSTGVQATLVLTTDYTVTGAGLDAGGNLTTVAAWDSTHTVTIYREVPATQLTSYAENDKFPAASHEAALDKLTYLVQQHARQIASCMRVTEASQAPGAGIPTALTFLTLDANGNAAFLTPGQAQSLLSLPAPILNLPLSVWANATARGLKVPDFIGQLGFQVDTNVLYYSTGLAAGNWTVYVPANSAASTLAASATKLATARAIALTGPVTGTANFDGTAGISIATSLLAGAVIQSVTGIYTANADLTTVIPLDDTIPQNTEGTQVLSVSITPTSTTSKIRVFFNSIASAASSGNTAIAALFNGGSSAVAVSGNVIFSSSTVINLVYESAAVGALTPITFTLRVGANTGTMRLNGTNSARLFGGIAASTMLVQEIKA
jgi:hypothetical protein